MHTLLTFFLVYQDRRITTSITNNLPLSSEPAGHISFEMPLQELDCLDSAYQFVSTLSLLIEPQSNRFVDVFTIRAVSQDDFEDVEVPAAPAQPSRAGTGSMASSALK
jgi:hypothetical protein